jgi:ribosomal protein L37E
MAATAPRKLHNATVTCPFCNGTGKLPHYSHVQNGDCFACGASGKLRDLNAFIGNCSDVVLTVWVNNDRFNGAELRRRTWKMSKCSVGSGANQKTMLCREWGRDSYYRAIDNVEEAREIWRNAKRLGIITELVD